MKKVVDNLGFAGTVGLLFGLVHYSIYQQWELTNQIALYGGLGLLAVYLIFKLPAIVAGLGTKGGRRGSLAGVSLLLVLGILGMANFLNYRYHDRWDFSENNLNSLSEQTVKVVGNLDRDVLVVGFFEDADRSRAFTSVVDEYRFLSPRIDYRVYDPRKNRSAVLEYQVEKDGQIIVKSGVKQQKVDSPSEEELTNAIIKVTRDTQKVICFLEGHGERSPDDTKEDGYLAIRGALERQNYEVIRYNLAVEGKLPENAAALISAGPKSNFLPNEVELLDGYLKEGGKFMLMVDPQSGFRMNDWLRPYGFAFDDDEVVDVSGLGSLFGLGVGAPVVSAYSNHPITAELEVVSFFPLARSLTQIDSSLGYEVQVLFSSSARSWGESDARDGARFDPETDKQGPLPLAVAATLKEESAVGGDVDPETESEESKRETRIVAVGDSDFVANRYLEIGGGHSDLFLNMVSWLVQDEDLIAVRPKNPTDRKVTLTETNRAILQWGSVILVPLAVLVFGISIWWRRR